MEYYATNPANAGGGLYVFIVIDALLWGLMALAMEGAVQGLYQRGFGSIVSAVELVGPPAAAFVISIALPLWLNYRNRRQAGLEVAAALLVIWIPYFIWAAMIAAA